MLPPFIMPPMASSAVLAAASAMLTITFESPLSVD
jgi:hypothetical protein